MSELGVNQANATAEALAREKIDAIYSSDLLRAIQTATPLSDLINIPIIKTSAFRERHVGVLEGLTFEESKVHHPNDYYALVNRNINHVITDGESYRQLLKRVNHELRKIIEKHNGERVAVFSHTGTICFMTLQMIGAINRFTKQTPWLVTSNCGINRFEIRGRNNVRVLSINDTRHLHQATGNDAFAAA